MQNSITSSLRHTPLTSGLMCSVCPNSHSSLAGGHTGAVGGQGICRQEEPSTVQRKPAGVPGEDALLSSGGSRPGSLGGLQQPHLST